MIRDNKDKKKTLWWRWIIALGSIVLILWIVSRQDWSPILSALRDPSGSKYLVLSIPVFFCGQIFACLRWLILLRIENPDFSFIESLRITLIGSFSSNFLPTSTGGDVVRIICLTDRKPTSRVAVILLDRLISVFSVILLLPFSIPVLILHNINGTSHTLLVTGQNGLLSFFVISSRLRNLLNKVKLWAAEIISHIAEWKKSKFQIFWGIVLSLLSNTSGWLAVWLIARGLNVNIELWQVIAAGVPIYFAGMLPISINGIGVQEFLYIGIFSIYNVPTSAAIMIGILTRLVYLLSVLPGGIWLMINPSLRTRIFHPEEDIRS
jgi:glycosyltransferase 2 family protein